MNGRLISSAIWVPLLLTPPTRLLIEELSGLLWPTVQPFTAIRLFQPRWIPFITFVVLGYVGVLLLSRFVLREFSSMDDPRVRHGAASFRGAATLVTAAWVVIALMTSQLTIPLFLVAVMAVIPFIGVAPTAPSPPEPSPLPPPQPPEPLPDFPDPSPVPSPSPAEDEEDQSSQYHRTYTWLYNDEPYRKSGRTRKFSVELSIEKSVYEEILDYDHTVRSSADYVEFANSQIYHETVAELASEIRQITLDQSLDELAEIHLAMAFTLSMPYAYDDDEYGRNYPKFPVEMLVDQKGDCEDFSILCGALLHRLGHSVALVLMEFSNKSHGHAALGVEPPQAIQGRYLFQKDDPNQKYYYCEVTPSLDSTTETSTNVQWWLGMDTPQHAQNFKVYPIG